MKKETTEQSSAENCKDKRKITEETQNQFHE
jgi:hypothetical protein